jgi:glycosyltransferase involved in cell wall biosynthesis
MRILVLNWQDRTNPLSGGAEVHLHNIFSRIAGSGHEVTLFCSSYPGAEAEECLDGIRVIRQGSRSFFNFQVPPAYLRRFRGENYDIVIDDVNKIPFFTPLFVRKPLFGIVHHLFGRSIFTEINPLAATYVSLMEKLALVVYRANRVPFFVVSSSTRDEMVNHGFSEPDLVLVHNCVDHALYRPDPARRSPAPVIGYCGRLKRYKGVDQLLRAVPQILKEVPGTRVVIVGEGDDRPRLQRMVRTLGLGHSVTFTGFVSESKKVEMLQSMWCGVNSSSKEGWGLTVVEANACGTPVIASDVPGLRDVVRDGDTGLLYRHGDVPQLAGRVVRVLRDTQLRERLTSGALAWASRFNWDTAAAETLAALQSRVARLTR